jgi:Holliday junction resolvase RusA-like endonuclease
MKVSFTVPGSPQGKGRPRFAKVGKYVKTYTPDQTVLYENLVAVEYRRQTGGYRFPDGVPLEMVINAFYAIPASASKTKRVDMLKGHIRPTKKPDADNVIKVVADSLNEIAYKDDAQIVSCRLTKFYGVQPGLGVTIQTAEAEISTWLPEIGGVAADDTAAASSRIAGS